MGKTFIKSPVDNHLYSKSSINFKESFSNVKLLEFEILGAVYNFEAGMTWGDWVNSEYNTYGYFVGSKNGIMEFETDRGGACVVIGENAVDSADAIIENQYYSVQTFRFA